MARTVAPLTERGIEPACDVLHRLAFVRAEFVSGTGDDDEVDERRLARDALEHGDGAELVLAALHDERPAARRGERGFVARTRPSRRRDGMSDDRERVGRLLFGKERAHPSAEAATNERNEVMRPPELVTRGAQVRELIGVVAARPPAARAERDGQRVDVVRGERFRKRTQDRLRRAAAVAGSEGGGAGAPALVARVSSLWTRRASASPVRRPTRAAVSARDRASLRGDRPSRRAARPCCVW